MKKRIQSLKSRASLLMLLAILSCDSFDGDFIDPRKQVTFSQTEYYLLPASAIIIDLQSVVEQTFTNASLKISQNPTRGELSVIDTFLLKYVPGLEFIEGKDAFIFSVIIDNEVIAAETISIFMVQDREKLPCGLFTIQDKASVKTGSSVAVKFLKNDRFCEIDGSSLDVSLHSSPRHGQATIVGDTTIVYTPDPTYTGRDEVIYKLSGSTNEVVSYGIVTLSVHSKSKIQILKAPGASTIFFVDENLGFVAGGAGSGIYKTTDGGEHWDKLPEPRFDPYDICTIDDILFLNANNGFAKYSSCVSGIATGGLISTTDGGASWKKIHVEGVLNSFFFTSLTTGFVGVNRYLPDSTEINKIYKTEDGGSSWSEVFTSPALGDAYLYWMQTIRFTDSYRGYALQSAYRENGGPEDDNLSRVFMTTDGGESWKESTSNKFIYSMAVLPENITCAIFSMVGDVTMPSSVVRSTDGLVWKPAASFLFESWRLGFSPSGNLGLTVGMSGPDPNISDSLSQIISFHKSTDKGQTWTKDEIGEPIYGVPWRIAVASDKVAYIICGGVGSKIIKYTAE